MSDDHVSAQDGGVIGQVLVGATRLYAVPRASAAALLVADKAKSLKEGLELAAKSVDTGAAITRLYHIPTLNLKRVVKIYCERLPHH